LKSKKITPAKWTFFILRIIVFGILIRNIFTGNYENVFTCILTLILFLVPYIIEHKFKLDIPEFLEIIIFLFIFSAEILGELSSFYTKIPIWDDILHTINGFIMGAIGLSLIELLNNNKAFKLKLSPFFIAFFTFCFSMTIGVVWEFFEYGMDNLLGLDMQKDTIVTHIDSVIFDPDNINNIHSIDIETLTVNSEDWIQKYGGYVDIGLHDTMNDLLVNFIGALTFAYIGYFYSKNQNSNKINRLLIVPKRIIN